MLKVEGSNPDLTISFFNWKIVKKSGEAQARISLCFLTIHETSIFGGREDLSPSLSQLTPNLLMSEGCKLSLQSQPVCDHWRFQEVGVIDLVNERALKRTSDEGGSGLKPLTNENYKV